MFVATELMTAARGGGSAEESLRGQAELGRLLAAAEGYRVVASDGTQVGRLDHVRYEGHADHPERIWLSGPAGSKINEA